MAWVKLDDQFPEHPKVLLAGPLAGWLHVCGLAYCNRMLTDGFVPAAKAHTLVDFAGVGVQTGGIPGVATFGHDVSCEELADALCEAGIWDRTRGGYLIRNYLEYQPSRAEVEAKRSVRSSAGKQGGKQSGIKRRSKREAKQEANGAASEEPKHELDANPVPDPVPPDVYKSPSSLTLVGPAAVEEEKLIRREAERRLAERSTAADPIVDPEAWLMTTSDGIRQERAEARSASVASARSFGANLVAGGAEADELTETFERRFGADPELLEAARAGAAEIARATA